ncbi:MAG: cytochrome c peroxidase [Tunicatimonas sp.]
MTKLILPLTLLIFAGVILSSFRDHAPRNSPAAEVMITYGRDLHALSQATRLLHEQARSLASTEDVPALQQALKRARLAYKRTEYLAEHLDGQFVADFINGAPLPKLERNAPNLSIVEPKGFQALEELIFGEDPLADRAKITELTELLDRNVSQFIRFQQRIPLTDRQVLEATRFELIRIFTLGVSGFDSPAALLSLPEAKASLEVMQQAVALYEPLLNAQHAELAPQVATSFATGIRYLAKHPDFDTFDRLHFLKTCINPLFEQVLAVQMALSIETYYETSPQHRKHAVNYFATNLFDEDLLNPFYYTRMPQSKYQPEVVELGRTLFFDPALSVNNQRSCASCHQPERGFTDGLAKSVALNNDGTVDRNAPTLLNAVYADRYFYDLRSEVLEDQMDHVVADHREFYTTYLDIFEKLQQSDEYQAQFAEAFPALKSGQISKYAMTTALAAYIVSLKSFNSPFDRYVRGESDDLNLSAQRGFNLFMGKAACGTCHFAPLFNGTVPPRFHESESEVLGVPTTKDTLSPTLDPDPGRAAGVIKEGVNFYGHSFKTTTVRNAALTAPYMHNGVYETLEEVVDFYNRGGGAGMGTDVPYQTLSPDPLHLSEQEQSDLVAFMESLTDTTSHAVPQSLPTFAGNDALNQRKIGGTY